MAGSPWTAVASRDGRWLLTLYLKGHGGFNHNLFGLRRVDELEERYPDFPGLNLSFEVREAFVSHCERALLHDVRRLALCRQRIDDPGLKYAMTREGTKERAKLSAAR